MKKPFIFIIILISVIPLIQSCSKNTDKLKFNNSELYFTKEVQKADAQKLGEYLLKEGFFNEEQRTVKLDKKENIWNFKMVVKKGADEDDQYIYLFGLFSEQLSKSVFNNAPVDIYLCNEKFETLRIIPFKTTNSKNNTL